MFRVTRWGWWNEPRDERELVRLELVGLAAEVAAVAEHAQGTLPPDGASARTDNLRARWRSYRESAHQVLATDASLDNLSLPELRVAVESLRGLQRKAARLRIRTEFATDTLIG